MSREVEDVELARLRELLEKVHAGELSVDEAIEALRHLPYQDLGFARIDTHRAIRRGFPEVVFCAGKTTEQVLAISRRMREAGQPVMLTKVSPELASAIEREFPQAVYHEDARIVVIGMEPPEPKGNVLVISAGTSDIPVAEEAAVTAAMLGAKVRRLYDVGVAGVHRLLGSLEELFAANVLVVVAGMEGALPSLVAGLVDKPVIAVPTSVGYGANLGGFTALFGMLTACAPGLAVVNIDNGFGAGYIAGLINRLAVSGHG